MKDFFILIKAMLRNTFRFDKTRKRGGGMAAAYIILGVVALPILALVAFGVYSLGALVTENGLDGTGVLTLLITICQFVVVIFGIPVILNTIYFSKDSEMLLALPVRPAVMFTAKFFVAYFIEFITSSILLLVAVVPFALGAGVFSVALLLSFFIVPLLPMLLAAVIAIPLMYVVSFFKNKGAVTSIVLIFLFGFFFTAYYLLVMRLQTAGFELSEDLGQVLADLIPSLDKFAAILFPNKFLAVSMLHPDFGTAALNFLYVLGINGALLAFTLFISSLVYRRSISKQLENVKNQRGRQIEFATKGKLSTLISKDIKEIMRYPSLAFYCLTQIIFAPIMMFVFGLMPNAASDGSGGALLGDLLGNDASLAAVIFLCAFMFLVFGMNYTAGSAISRENHNFYILKILPVPYSQILDAKAILGFATNVITIILSLIIGIITMKLPLVSVLLILAAGSLFSYAFSYFQVLMDLMRPRLKWDNPARGLKNAASIYLTMLLSLAVIVVLVIAYVVFMLLGSSVGAYVFWTFVFLAGIGACWLGRVMLMKNASRLMETIEF